MTDPLMDTRPTDTSAMMGVLASGIAGKRQTYREQIGT